METPKFKISRLSSLLLLFFLIGTVSSCGTKSSEQESDHHHDNTAESDKHTHAEEPASLDENTSDHMMWTPTDKPFTGLLKLAQGDEVSLVPTITTESDGTKILTLIMAGNQVTLLFDGMLEDVGANLEFKTENFTGEIAIVHHYTDASNYDYLSITNSSMQLGRIQNGKSTILNKKDKKMPADWTILTVTSAGEHYKGLLNEELVNHGHDKTRIAGQAGILLNGNGKVMLKMMEVMKLSE